MPVVLVGQPQRLRSMAAVEVVLERLALIGMPQMHLRVVTGFSLRLLGRQRIMRAAALA